MKPVDMIIKHDPSKGIYGDCFRCCIASILELPAIEVPHFMELGEKSADIWYPNLNKWLEQRGFGYLEFEYPEKQPFFSTDLAKMFNAHYVFSGMSPRDRHATVGRNGFMVHDPHPDRTGLIGPYKDTGTYSYGFIVKG